jgi:demethylmenaquinone methyltransferase/2-methoxy-6-polyprenyl-1,4-benzoquinol methylase
VDAFNLQNVPPGKNAGFGGFIWSHVSKTRRPKLIHSFHSRLKDNSPVIWVDNRYVEGSSTAISRRDSAGNTYQIRLLTDGSRHEIIKNYPLEEELRQDFKPFARNIKVNYFQYYWLLSYNVKKDRLDIPDPAKNENSKFKTRKLS